MKIRLIQDDKEPETKPSVEFAPRIKRVKTPEEIRFEEVYTEYRACRDKMCG